jgi:uncharacterized membrane protein
MNGRDPESPSESDGESLSSRVSDDLSAFTAVTTNFYRAEVERMTTWRGRLDQTTNWAVVIVAAILTWAFTSSDNPHYVILIGMFGITAFLLMEAHRYREYDAWRDRVRTLQKEFIADVYAPDSDREGNWQTDLGEELRAPTFEISVVKAINHRLRRSYLALLLILLVAWIARITTFEASEPWQQTASIFVIPGEVVLAVVALFYAIIFGIVIWSAQKERTQEFEG